MLTRLQDEAAIRAAIARFADTAIRGDDAGFRASWSDDAEWVVGATEGRPAERRATGADEIMALFHTLRDEREYFVQFAVPGAIEISGDTASVHCVCYETGRGPDESRYRNTGIWSDHLRRSGDRWVFTSRVYRSLWLDLSAFLG